MRSDRYARAKAAFAGGDRSASASRAQRRTAKRAHQRMDAAANASTFANGQQTCPTRSALDHRATCTAVGESMTWGHDRNRSLGASAAA